MQGNFLLDLGTPSTWKGTSTSLAPGQRLFHVPEDLLGDGYNALDLHIMGLSMASEVGSFFYVDEPESIFTGQSLDGFDPNNPLNTTVIMRTWAARGGVLFRGKRVDLTMADIQAYEKLREGNDNPKGKRFWGPKGNLKVRYNSITRLVDPNGDASITLSEEDRELGDEADMIDQSGKPVDIKTMAFVLVVQNGDPSAHSAAISQMDTFRKTWASYVNGPATGGRGKFDTRLNPSIY
jgi:hypothetical protein